jgi:hypothetical protein
MHGLLLGVESVHEVCERLAGHAVHGVPHHDLGSRKDGNAAQAQDETGEPCKNG